MPGEPSHPKDVKDRLSLENCSNGISSSTVFT